MSAENNLLTATMLSLYREAVERLAPREKTILHLRYIERLTLDEIGDLLGLDLDGVIKRLDRALYLIAERTA